MMRPFFFFLLSVFQTEQQLRPLHEGTNLNLKTPTSRCVKSPLFFVHSTMASNYSTAFISSSTLRVEAEQMLPILFSSYHRLKFNLSWCAQRFLLQYAYILAVWFACCAAFMLPGGGRSRRQISSLAPSLLNYQLEFISLEDNNSHRARRMSPVLLLFASAAAAWHRHCREKWAAYALYKPRDTLGHFVRRQKLHKPNKPDGLLNSSMGCIYVSIWDTERKIFGMGEVTAAEGAGCWLDKPAVCFPLVLTLSGSHITAVLAWGRGYSTSHHITWHAHAPPATTNFELPT